MAAVPHVLVYARQGCSPCLATEAYLRDLSVKRHFVLTVLDIDLDPAPPPGISDRVPVVVIDGVEVMAERFVPEVLQDAIEEAFDRLR